MLITIVNVSEPQAVKKYFTIEVAYKNDKGQVQGKKLMSFTYPLVYSTLKGAQAGETYDVTLVKEGDFWNWTAASKVEGGSQEVAQQTKTQAFAQGSQDRFETKEERLARQRYIVRQSSLSTAVETLAVGSKTALDPNAVIAVARQYEEFVFGTGVQGIIDMQDDLPE